MAETERRHRGRRLGATATPALALALALALTVLGAAPLSAQVAEPAPAVQTEAPGQPAATANETASGLKAPAAEAAPPAKGATAPNAAPAPAAQGTPTPAGQRPSAPVAAAGTAPGDAAAPAAAVPDLAAAPDGTQTAGTQAGGEPSTDLSDAGQGAGPDPATLPHDLSPWSMFLNADRVVQAVMIGLALASLATWTIWLAKTMELLGARRRARSATRKLARADSFEAAAREIGASWVRRGPVAEIVRAAEGELARSADLAAEGVKERVAIALSRIEARAGRTIARGTGILATVGAISPFVGLFGTVWGIMNAFVGISKAHTTNLAVVAPGIAEALLTTAIGLVAAIPAVILYNLFTRTIAAYRAQLSDASGEVLQHLSRDLERRARSLGSGAQAAGGPALRLSGLRAGAAGPAE